MTLKDIIASPHKNYALKLVMLILCGFLINATLVVAAAPTGTETMRSFGTIAYMTPLHIEGRYIKDAFGNTVVLKGFQKHGFEDYPEGTWQSLDWNYFNSFNEDVVKLNFQEMKSWGANEIRVIDRAQYWIENTVGGTGMTHRNAIKRLIQIASEEGLYVVYCLFAMDGYTGYHDVPWGTGLIPTMTDFVNLWRDIATELSVYPNVLFELWNEVADNQDAWFNGCQQTISAIRGICDNIIVIQWNWDVWYRERDTYAGTGTIEWAIDPRIQGENILYSTHMYHESRGYYQPDGSSERTYFYEYDDIKRAFQAEMIEWLINEQNKPLYVGEFGPYHYDFDVPPNELQALDNALTILDEWGVSYSCMWWWYGSYYALFEGRPDNDDNGCDWNSLTEWGEIVQSHLSGL